eukprot:TRINITY_DN1070_c0_g2_i2.p1 TRINITY_DN1070_c0_g2~~TRINITY_DN1070_c0_g2_i2.p1  ORF type:complete len:1041 (-),score=77.24 TRINITY_DN1070_c0_g2_i2:934-4056(-)
MQSSWPHNAPQILLIVKDLIQKQGGRATVHQIQQHLNTCNVRCLGSQIQKELVMASQGELCSYENDPVNIYYRQDHCQQEGRSQPKKINQDYQKILQICKDYISKEGGLCKTSKLQLHLIENNITCFKGGFQQKLFTQFEGEFEIDKNDQHMIRLAKKQLQDEKQGNQTKPKPAWNYKNGNQSNIAGSLPHIDQHQNETECSGNSSKTSKRTKKLNVTPNPKGEQSQPGKDHTVSSGAKISLSGSVHNTNKKNNVAKKKKQKQGSVPAKSADQTDHGYQTNNSVIPNTQCSHCPADSTDVLAAVKKFLRAQGGECLISQVQLHLQQVYSLCLTQEQIMDELNAYSHGKLDQFQQDDGWNISLSRSTNQKTRKIHQTQKSKTWQLFKSFIASQGGSCTFQQIEEFLHLNNIVYSSQEKFLQEIIYQAEGELWIDSENQLVTINQEDKETSDQLFDLIVQYLQQAGQGLRLQVLHKRLQKAGQQVSPLQVKDFLWNRPSIFFVNEKTKKAREKGAFVGLIHKSEPQSENQSENVQDKQAKIMELCLEYAKIQGGICKITNLEKYLRKQVENYKTGQYKTILQSYPRVFKVVPDNQDFLQLLQQKEEKKCSSLLLPQLVKDNETHASDQQSNSVVSNKDTDECDNIVLSQEVGAPYETSISSKQCNSMQQQQQVLRGYQEVQKEDLDANCTQSKRLGGAKDAPLNESIQDRYLLELPHTQTNEHYKQQNFGRFYPAKSLQQRQSQQSTRFDFKPKMSAKTANDQDFAFEEDYYGMWGADLIQENAKELGSTKTQTQNQEGHSAFRRKNTKNAQGSSLHSKQEMSMKDSQVCYKSNKYGEKFQTKYIQQKIPSGQCGANLVSSIEDGLEQEQQHSQVITFCKDQKFDTYNKGQFIQCNSKKQLSNNATNCEKRNQQFTKQVTDKKDEQDRQKQFGTWGADLVQDNADEQDRQKQFGTWGADLVQDNTYFEQTSISEGFDTSYQLISKDNFQDEQHSESQLLDEFKQQLQALAQKVEVTDTKIDLLQELMLDVKEQICELQRFLF